MIWTDHLPIVPILLPLVAGAVLALVNERRHRLKAGINLAATIGFLAVSAVLVGLVDAPGAAEAGLTRSYALGGWPAPFGIVIVLDRLSALMLALTAVLALAALVFALSKWHRAGPHFHTLFQFLLMGLAGTYLTGDLFNLFVFFEVMLAASYGLMLHGSGAFRVRAGLHYIVVNLVASLLFLIGVSLVYGVTGTLNMADLALRLPQVPPGDRMLLEAGLGALGIAFFVKAGMWPLCFWLPTAYTAATAPVAALFVVLSKAGVYVLFRLMLLLFGFGGSAIGDFGGHVLLTGGLATIAFGAVGVLASQGLGRLAGYSVLVSSGTMLAALGLGDARVLAGALFYLVSSTLSVGAFYLLIELIERAQAPGTDLLSVTMEAYGEEFEDEEPIEEEVGPVMPGALAFLALCFGAATLLIAGLPPLSGFIGKLALLEGMFGRPDLIPTGAWVFSALLVLSGLAVLVAMIRIGIRTFWAPLEVIVPRVFVLESTPVAFLILLCVLLTFGGDTMMRYAEATVSGLATPSTYIEGVLPAAGASTAEAVR